MGMMWARVWAVVLMASGAAAEDAGPGGAVAIELNRVSGHADACTLTFLVTNGHAAPLDQLIYETVLFDRAGQVERLTLFDFGALPPSRPRVRQFAVPDLACERLGRVLFNGVHACEGVAADACAAPPVPSSRVEVEVLG